MVLNGTASADRTSKVASSLGSRGFTVLGTGDAPLTTDRRSVVEYARTADLPAARTLQAQFPGSVLKRASSLVTGTVDVTLGATFIKLAPPKPTSAARIKSL